MSNSRTRKWELPELQLDALNFNTPTEWARGSSGAYSAASVMGVLDECCWHMQGRVKDWTKARAIADASKYKTRIEWKKNSNSAYAASRRNGWMDEACQHMVVKRRPCLTKDMILASAAQHATRGNWQDCDASAYTVALRKGLLEEACAHMPKPPSRPEKWEVLASSRDYSSVTEWKDACGREWAAAQHGDYMKEACAHMVRLAHKPSNLEQAVFELVKSFYPDALQSDTSILGRKQLDIVVPSKGLAIEFNGLIWHSSKMKTPRNYHQDKTDAAAAAGYRLIHIWSDEWVKNQAVAEAYLRMQLIGPDRKIGARKCTVLSLSADVAMAFHKAFHLQGGRGGEHLGLYYGDELLAVATVSGNELARWTVYPGVVVVGGLSKVMKHINRDIISYCDTAKHTGAGYLAAGFTLVGSSQPSYYYTDGNSRFNRVGFQKHKLLQNPNAVGETEVELAASLGFYQIGGCRQLKFEFKAKRLDNL